jgi:RHS repeat-associated protein
LREWGFYPEGETFGYGIEVEVKDNVGGIGSVLKIGIDHFSSNLRSVKVKGVFPYEGIEYMGWRFNDKLGGGGEGKANYWVIKGLGGGEISVYEVDEGGELRVEIPEGTEKINLGLVRDRVKKRLGSIFTNMSKEELVSFLSGKGLELVGFVEGVWEKSVNGDWVRPSVREGIRYFVPLLDKEGYIISDWRGVPRVVYDEGGKEIWRGEFGPFGEPLYERGVVSNYIPFRLYGMYKDIETGLYYNVRRYYDWRVGRYLQPDPVSDLNLYVYVNNSPYDLVDPRGMFKTELQVVKTFIGTWHEGKPIHEEITERAINETFLCSQFPSRKICEHGSRCDECGWKGPYAFDILRCRSYENRVAQGVNIADCLYETDSSFHCDNNNFGGCYDNASKLEKPVASGLITCYCYDEEGSDTWKWEGYGSKLGKFLGELIEGLLPACSVANQRLKKKSSSYCSCSFGTFQYGGESEGMDFEKLGRLLHPVQDFWAHSTAFFVEPVLKMIVPCSIDPSGLCPVFDYPIQNNWPYTSLPTPIEASNIGLESGKYDSGGWSWLEDLACAWPPCKAHCILNKDEPGGDYCWSSCDSECSIKGAGNVQKFAHNDAKEMAVASTKRYLLIFCSVEASICY